MPSPRQILIILGTCIGCSVSATAGPGLPLSVYSPGLLAAVPASENPVPAGLECGGLPVTLAGTAGDDILTGTPEADVIHGLGGNDRIAGLAGDDVICGGAGDDHLAGGEGNDSLFGGDGSDRLYGSAGDDLLRGGEGTDVLNAGSGFNRCDDGGLGDSERSCNVVELKP